MNKFDISIHFKMKKATSQLKSTADIRPQGTYSYVHVTVALIQELEYILNSYVMMDTRFSSLEK